jgi:hypothetical protein
VNVIDPQSEAPMECGQRAYAKVGIAVFGNWLLKDLHVCVDHFKAFSGGGIEIQANPISRIVAAGYEQLQQGMKIHTKAGNA